MLKESLGPTALLEQVTEQDAWYWWRLEHWGTKWDLTRDDIEVSESEGEDCVETENQVFHRVVTTNSCDRGGVPSLSSLDIDANLLRMLNGIRRRCDIRWRE